MRFLILGMVGALCIAGMASASMTSNTVEPKGKLGRDGETAKVNVLLACDAAQTAKLKVSVTQGSANEQERAFGKGGAKVECGAEDATYRVAATAKKGVFAAGKSTVCVLALTDDDARQWCVDVKLKG